MSTTFYTITLQTLHVHTKKPLAGLRIEVWDKDATLDDFLVQATTDKAGNAKIQFTSEQFREAFGDQSPDLYFKVYRGDKQVADTEGQIMWNVGKKTSKITIAVNEEAFVPKATSYNITLQTVDVSTKKPLGNLRIEVWDKDRINDDFLAEGITDKAGNAQVQFTSEKFREVFGDQSPDLYFKVYRGEKLVADTEGQIMWNTGKKTSKITIAVNAVGGEGVEEKAHSVRGSVTLSGGKPAVGVLVKAFHQLLTDETLLGEVVTDFNGAYGITYSPVSGGTHVFIRVYDSAGESQLLAESEAVYYAKADTVIEQQLPEGKSSGLTLFETITKIMQSLPSGVKPEALAPKQIVLLSQTTGIAANYLQGFADAAALHNAYLKLPAAFFFGVAQGGTDISEQNWLRSTFAEISHALQVAAAEFYIRPFTGAEIKIIEAEFRLQRSRFYLETAPLANNSSLQDIFGLLALPENARLKTAALYGDYGNDAARFWDAVSKDSALATHAADLKRTFTFHRLALGNMALLQLLLADAKLHSVADLAALDVSEWESLVKKEGVAAGIPEQITGDTPGARIQTYAQYLLGISSALHPTSAVSGRIQKDASYTKAQKLSFMKFFAANPEFRIELHSTDAWLHNHPEALAGIAEPEKFKQELFRLSTRFAMAAGYDRYASMNRLQQIQMHSAGHVMKKGSTSFTQSYTAAGGTAEEAAVIFNHAQTITLQTQMFELKYTHDQQLPLYVINNAVQQDSTWQQLFGSEDYCSCTHCRSLYSPAAYLADLLGFLQKREVAVGKTALDVLTRRRPDLLHILLNCENANTAMPYIDLVNEILETVIAGVPEAPYQTTGDTQDLLVLPEHLNEKAYATLRDAVYPWDTPFDLFTETGRLFLAHAGVRHDEIVKLFSGGKLTEKNYVKAVLGITENEYRILTCGSETGAPEYEEARWWNYTFRTATEFSVMHILGLTGLKFPELEEVLLTKFVNADGTVQLSTACSLEEMQISGLSKNVRRKILKLVRLQRRLGLSISQADQLLFARNISDISATTLAEAAQFILLRRRFSIPAEELLSWWGRMATKHILETTPGFYEQVFLNRSVQQKWLSENPDPARLPFENFLLHTHGDGLRAPVDITNGSNFSYVASVLQVSLEDLEDLLSMFDGSQLDLAMLSRLYAAVSFTKAMKCTVRQLLDFEKVSGYSQSEPLQTLQLVGALDSIRHNNWTLSEFLGLAVHRGENNNSWSVEKKKLLAEKMIAGLKDLRLEEEAGIEFNPYPLVNTELALAAGMNPDLIHLVLVPESGKKAYLKSKVLDGENLALAIVKRLEENAGDISAAIDAINPDLLLFQKVCWLINKLDWSNPYMEKLLSSDGKDYFDFNHLPVSDGEHMMPGDCNGLLSLLDYRWLSDRVIQPEFVLIGEVNNLEIAKAFESSSEEQAKIAELLTQTALPSGKVGKPRWIYDAVIMRRTLGVRWTDFEAQGKIVLAEPAFNAATTRRIEAIAKAKYTESAWRSTGAKLRDRLRVQQRDALVAYLLHTSQSFHSADDLYAHYLVDVEMGSCMQTSRIRLALSSVQLFVQRCLLGLEDEIDLGWLHPLDRADWEEWAWRKNYRVWEANRKIFLYPENWLEPEWRDDKTPFFEELEQELEQGELTSELAEKALMNYLGKLATVSNLEIMAMCKSDVTTAADETTYYIFGRTVASPDQFYFRKYVETSTGWYFTAWEKIDAAVEGDHWVPVVKDGQLYLFWVLFSEKEKEGAKTETDGFTTFQNGKKYLQMKFAYSRYDENQWGPKIVLDAVIDEPQKFIDTGKDIAYRKKALFVSFDTGISNDDAAFLTLNIWGYAGRPNDTGLIVNPLTRVLLGYLHIYSNNSAAPIVYSFGAKFNNYVTTGGRDFLWGVSDVLNGKYEAQIDRNIAQLLMRCEGDFYLLHIQDRVLNVQGIHDAGFKMDCSNINLSGRPFILEGRSRTMLGRHVNKKIRLVSLTSSFYQSLYRQVQERMPSGPFDYQSAMSGSSETTPWISALDPASQAEISSAIELFPADNLFSGGAPYSQYNWELFFHIPMLVATRLTQNQRHEEAQKWFHYVFNPNTTQDGAVPARFWNFKPFAEYTGLTDIRELTESTAGSFEYREFEAEVKQWEKNPFNPHLIARARPVAYMRWVVMKYIDNLLEWGDMLFRQDTMESLNEATQLYMLAWDILGRRQEELPGYAHRDQSFSDIRGELDPLSNADVPVLEERIASSYAEARTRETQIVLQNSSVPATQYTVNNNLGQDVVVPEWETSVQAELYILRTRYFCTPPNDKLAGYWDFLRDRFFKLRNCRNIEGEFRMLPLYEPPIDPSLLIRAQQAGMTIADALASASESARPHYRFVYLLQRAIDFANDLRAIGSGLLSAIEKKDNEELALLRVRHEQAMHNAVLENRRLLIQESKESQSALEYSLNIAKRREEFYRSREFMNSSEKMQFILTALTSRMQLVSQGLNQLSALEKAALDFYAGYAGMGGLAATSGGGSKLGDVSDSVAEAFSKMASVFNISASEIGQMASYGRRYEEWMHQAEQAGDEISQIEKQILAAQIRTAISEQEFRNQELHIEQMSEQYQLMMAKFSGKELYQWTITQFKAIYYQAYQAAVSMAQAAEAALKYELPQLDTRSYIRYGYWDNMKAGLLSGEKLHHDLKQMEVAYLTNNKRLHEITKTVSLAMVSAEALVELKNIGSCGFRVPEALFNLDFPQHAGKLRRIKAVSLSVPCVTGPYTGVNCILTATSPGMSSSIATSSGLNDTGLFQFSFNDERYLPFEGMPVNCEWTIEMNSSRHAFDYGSISDVLLHIHYTTDTQLDALPAEEESSGSGPANNALALTRYISLRNEFADEWIRFKNNPQLSLEITVNEKLFPYMFRQDAMSAIGEITAWTKTGDTYTMLGNGAVEFVSPKISVNGTGLGAVDDVLLAVPYTVTVN